jgi:hypothetical protein
MAPRMQIHRMAVNNTRAAVVSGQILEFAFVYDSVTGWPQTRV